MTSKSPQEAEKRRRAEIARLKKLRDRLLIMAEHGRIVQDNVNHPLWTAVILDILEQRMRSYQEFDCWSLKGAELEEAKIRAQFCRELRDYVLTVGQKREENLSRAERIGAILETEAKKG